MQIEEAKKNYVRWLRTTRGLSSHTVRAYEGDVGVLTTHLGPRILVKDISADLLVDLIETMRTTGMSDSSIRRRVAGIRSFSQWLLATELIDSNSWFEPSLRIPIARTLPRAVPVSDLSLLLSYLRAAAEQNARTDPLSAIRKEDGRTTLDITSEVLSAGPHAAQFLMGMKPGLEQALTQLAELLTK